MALTAAKVNLAGRLETDDGTVLNELIALDRFIAVDKRPGKLALTAKGPLDGELALDGQLAIGALTIAASGTMRTGGDAGPTVGLNLRVANANIRSPRPVAAGRPAEFVPASLAAGIDLIEGRLHLTNTNFDTGRATKAGEYTLADKTLQEWQQRVERITLRSQ